MMFPVSTPISRFPILYLFGGCYNDFNQTLYPLPRVPLKKPSRMAGWGAMVLGVRKAWDPRGVPTGTQHWEHRSKFILIYMVVLYIVFWSSVFFYIIVWKFIGLHIYIYIYIYIYMERIGTPLEWGFHTRRRSNMWVHWPFDPSPCALETGFDHIQAPWSISQHLPEKQKNINPSHLGFLYGVHISHDGSMVLVY